jgi:DNA (cytosine-5)-methyltransferase 1
MPQSIAAVDLFCGVGGLSLGLTQAGIDVRLGVDIDPACQYPFENNNSARFLLKDVRQLTGSEIISAWAGAKYRVIAGCAPCQPFSHYSCGRRYDRSEDWNLLNEFSRLTKESLPDVVTMENVPKLTRHPIFTQFVAALKQLGYTVNYKRVECRQYGVPQTRKRLVLLASRFGQMTLLPGVYAEKSFVTVRQVIAHLPTIAAGEVCPEDPLHQAKKLSAKNLQRIRNSQPGGTWRD